MRSQVRRAYGNTVVGLKREIDLPWATDVWSMFDFYHVKGNAIFNTGEDDLMIRPKIT